MEEKETGGKSMYLELFWTFFKLGLFTIGGGMAMIPVLTRGRRRGSVARPIVG